MVILGTFSCGTATASRPTSRMVFRSRSDPSQHGLESQAAPRHGRRDGDVPVRGTGEIPGEYASCEAGGELRERSRGKPWIECPGTGELLLHGRSRLPVSLRRGAWFSSFSFAPGWFHVDLSSYCCLCFECLFSSVGGGGPTWACSPCCDRSERDRNAIREVGRGPVAVPQLKVPGGARADRAA